MDAVVVVDMQVGLLNGLPKHDLQGVIQRINLLTAMYGAALMPRSDAQKQVRADSLFLP